VCNGSTGAPRHVQLMLPACGQPVRLARQVTREVLCAWQLADVEETAVLLVSELVSNAVRNARGSDLITLELKAMPTCLRIEAYRCQPGQVAPRTAGEFDDLGFGCALVESLASQWGVRETVTGTTIWAELDT
jgi:serine/threonine-protein kinase RsbW